MRTTAPHADLQTLLIATALAVRARRHRHVTRARVLALELVTVAGIAQEERLITHAVHTIPY